MNVKLPNRNNLVLYCKEGWTRFEFNPEKKIFEVTYPPQPVERAFAYETETFVKGSPFAMPIMATAASTKAIYVWLSPQLADSEGVFDLDTAPMPSVGRNRFIICHNVAYDSPRCQERYILSQDPVNYWFDTMSANRLVSGFNSTHFWVTKAKDKSRLPKYARYGCANSLAAAYQFHLRRPLYNKPGVARKRIRRTPTDSLLRQNRSWRRRANNRKRGFYFGRRVQITKKIRDLFVKADTLADIRAELPILLEYAVIDAVSTLQLGQVLWPKFREQCPSLVTAAAHFLLADSLLPLNPEWDNWLDRCNRAMAEKEQEVEQLLKSASNKAYEFWLNDPDAVDDDPFYSQMNWKPKRGKELPRWMEETLTTRKVLTHMVLRITYRGYPVYKTKNMGYCYRDRDGIERRVLDANENVGGLLKSSYSRFYEDGTLETSVDPAIGLRMCEISEQITFWSGYQSRVNSIPTQMIELPDGSQGLGTAPRVTPANTMSGRTGENVFLVTAAHTKPKIGSALNSKVHAWPGYRTVNYDFDSQELNCLAVYADSYQGISGSSALGQIVLIGDKKKKTELFWVVAKQAGIDRTPAKNSTYAMCYGGETKTVSEYMLEFNPNLTVPEARALAQKVIRELKGSKTGNRYRGGIASGAFNKMYDLLNQDVPIIPLSGTIMQPSMWPENCGDSRAPYQLNYFVQGSGSAQLHTSLLANWWLCKHTDTIGYLGVTKHDELMYQSPDDHCLRLAYLMQIGHMWGWSLLHYKCNVYDLPIKRAFASTVNVDKIWRKEVDLDVRTPTSPEQPCEDGIGYSMRELVKKDIGNQLRELYYDDD